MGTQQETRRKAYTVIELQVVDLRSLVEIGHKLDEGAQDGKDEDFPD